MTSSCMPPVIFSLISVLVRILLLFGGAFILLWYYLKRTKKPVVPAVTNSDHATILPLRLQAYERLVLFLERIHPSNLVVRLNTGDLTAFQLQSLLVRTIREEFEYNLSQQLYISLKSWELIKNAKEETISMINLSTTGLTEQAGSSELVKKVFELTLSRGKLPVESALEEVKLEVQKLF